MSVGATSSSSPRARSRRSRLPALTMKVQTMKECIRHKLIIFYGAGSGIGKSTLSNFTQKQLQLNGTDSRLVREEDVPELGAFAQ